MTELARERMEVDLLVVGGGPAGLAAAIRFKQLQPDASVCLLEKGGEIGAHILSGAVIDPRALDELLPEWRQDAPAADLGSAATEDRFLLLDRRRAWGLPIPAPLANHGALVGSLGNLCRWLARQAEALGVEIYPGFAATEAIEEDGIIRGLVAGEQGRRRDGTPRPDYQPGMELRAPCILLAEGCRGVLAQGLIRRFHLDEGRDPQTYGIGIKELWEIPAEHHRPGLVLHTLGWPLDRQTYGGGFLYHWGKNLVSTGLVIGLDYRDPMLEPFAEMQRWKTHPALAAQFAGGRRIAYGARALVEGGLQSLPRLAFPGGALIGDAAGFLNAGRIKGTHTAMKSGMLAAEAAVAARQAGSPGARDGYEPSMRASWLGQELHRARNIRPGFARFGLYGGLLHAAVDGLVLRGQAPWTLRHHQPDHLRLRPAGPPREYPKPDGVLSFDLLSSVFISNTMHEEDQPVHLKLLDEAVWRRENLHRLGAPETRYCPAGVYELAGSGPDAALRINAANCLHCKTCDIKDPAQNIRWTAPEGGGGPNYPGGM